MSSPVPVVDYAPKPNWSWQRTTAPCIDPERCDVACQRPEECLGSMEPPRLDQIASLIRSLTYGEMLELAKELWTHSLPAAGGDELTQADLPPMLHKWSKSRS